MSIILSRYNISNAVKSISGDYATNLWTGQIPPDVLVIHGSYWMTKQRSFSPHYVRGMKAVNADAKVTYRLLNRNRVGK